MAPLVREIALRGVTDCLGSKSLLLRCLFWRSERYCDLEICALLMRHMRKSRFHNPVSKTDESSSSGKKRRIVIERLPHQNRKAGKEPAA